RNTMAEKLFGIPLLRFFGKYSYGLYVYHYSIDGYLTNWLRPWLFGYWHSKLLSIIATAFISAFISLFVAFASYNLFEIHFLKLKHFFPYISQKEAYLTSR